MSWAKRTGRASTSSVVGSSRGQTRRAKSCAQTDQCTLTNAVNPYSNASGLFQFLPGTWKTTPFADQDIFDPTANAEAAAWMWSVGRRNEWTCQ